MERKDCANEIENFVFQCGIYVCVVFTRFMHKSSTHTHTFYSFIVCKFRKFYFAHRNDDTCSFFSLFFCLFMEAMECECISIRLNGTHTHTHFQSILRFACLNKFLRLRVMASASVTKIDYMSLIDTFRCYVHDTLLH